MKRSFRAAPDLATHDYRPHEGPAGIAAVKASKGRIRPGRAERSKRSGLLDKGFRGRAGSNGMSGGNKRVGAQRIRAASKTRRRFLPEGELVLEG